MNGEPVPTTIAAVDRLAEVLSRRLTEIVLAEGITGPLTIGTSARISTIAEDFAGPDWTFGQMVDVRTNRVVVTALAFHGKVEE